MTANQQWLVGAGGGGKVLKAWVLTRSVATGVDSARQTLTYGSDGTCTASAGLTVTTTGDPWYTPTTAGIGASYWVKFTQLSGDTLDYAPGGLGVWISLSALTAIGFNGFTSGNKTATWRAEFATDSLGNNRFAICDNNSMTVNHT